MTGNDAVRWGTAKKIPTQGKNSDQYDQKIEKGQTGAESALISQGFPGLVHCPVKVEGTEAI
jgi:hypothetical protein